MFVHCLEMVLVYYDDWQYSGFQSSLSVYVHTVFNQQKMGVQMSED